MGPISTLFCPIFFFKEFCPILSSFCGLEGHFQGEIEEKFFPPKMCFHTLGGGPGGVEKIHTFYFFFEGFPKYLDTFNFFRTPS